MRSGLVKSAHQLIRSAASQTRLGSRAERRVAAEGESRSVSRASRLAQVRGVAGDSVTLSIRRKSRRV
jgi:hypothetical protein